jgi:cobalamin biosynthesis Mg chelatase CobN
MSTCSTCGSEIAADDVFCPNCGTRQALSENRIGSQDGSRSAAAGGSAEPAAVAVGTAIAATAPRAGALGAPGEPSWGVMAAAPAPEDRPGPPIPTNASALAGETLEHRYLRQTRNATVFIAVIVGIVTVIALIGIIWTATTISKLDSELDGSSNLFNTSNCQSQGGTDPSC